MTRGTEVWRPEKLYKAACNTVRPYNGPEVSVTRNPIRFFNAPVSSPRVILFAFYRHWRVQKCAKGARKGQRPCKIVR